ncbi:hypothetical protein JCM10207_007406 [Rhodosporidiobolus poonsookiae]
MALRLVNPRLPPELLTLARSPTFARHLSTSLPRQNNPDKSFYATTPIFYVNADPHIGHLHSTLLADVYARYARLRDPQKGAVMCTGTDEHGLKIQRVAEAKGISPKALCDGVSERFRDLAKAANVDYQVFIRTTEERHRTAVEHVWRELCDRGFIYKSSYAGWYAVSDEAYVPEGQVAEVIDPKSGEKYMASTETGTRVEWMEEQNYKFRLSAFREPLLKWLQSTPLPVQPPSRSTALVSSLLQPTSTDLNDLSISRPSSRLSWGIRVPDDPEHTIYVWIDALVNYLTVAGYPWKGGEAFAQGKVWPPDLQVVGKDIIRFHALYLPAVLLALDLPLPKHILTHGHWTMDKFKMSKSRGNVANPFEAMKLWGIDAMRMYLMRVGGNSGSDADYSATEIERFYRKDLAGQMGNLVNRIANKKLLKKLPSPEALYTMPQTVGEEDRELVKLLEELPATFDTHLSSFEVHRALAAVFDVLAASNRHVQALSPWLPSATPSDVHRALFLGSESLRLSGILLQPFMPDKAAQLLDMLGVPAARRRWEDAQLGQGGKRTPVVGKTHLWPSIVAAEAVSSYAWNATDAGTTASRRGASLTFWFAGEQVSLYGFASAAFTVSIDGASADSASYVTAASNSTTSNRIFLTSNLDAETVHQLVLEVTGSGSVVLDQVALAYSNALKMEPVLVAPTASGAVSTATLPLSATLTLDSASATSTRRASRASSSSAVSSGASTSAAALIPTAPADSSSDKSSTDSKSSSSGGKIAGGVIGALAGVSLLVFLVMFFLRRRQNRSAPKELKLGRNRSSYLNTETGAAYSATKRRSAFLSGLRFAKSRDNLALPFEGRNSGISSGDGNHGTTPHPFASAPRGAYVTSPTTATPTSETWASRLCRAASWQRRAERLHDTRTFYNVPEHSAVVASAGPPPPPPDGPLFAAPGADERVMQERWRAGPTLAGALGAHALVDAHTVQVYGEALSDASGSEEAHAPSSANGRLSYQAYQHPARQPSLTRRVSGGVVPFPATEPAGSAAPVGRDNRTSFRNPFASTPSVSPYRVKHGAQPSYTSSATGGGGGGGQFRSGSGYSAGPSTPGYGPNTSRESSDDAERADIHTAGVVAVPSAAAAAGSLHPDDVALYSLAQVAIPRRVSSKRAARAAADAAAAEQGVRAPEPVLVRSSSVLARKPTLTRRASPMPGESAAGADTDDPTTPLQVLSPGFGKGYEAQEVVEELSSAAKHRSVAGLIETVESLDELLDGVDGSAKRQAQRDPPPGEEDRSAFFAKRERMPRYSVDGRDPRRPHRRDGSINRSG